MGDGTGATFAYLALFMPMPLGRVPPIVGDVKWYLNVGTVVKHGRSAREVEGLRWMDAVAEASTCSTTRQLSPKARVATNMEFGFVQST